MSLQAAQLPAQTIERSLALGVVAPVGSFAESRTVGPAVRAGVTVGNAENRRTLLRIELEGAWFLSRGAKSGAGYTNRGSLSATSVLASLVVGRRPTEDMAPYFLTGLAIQRLTIPGVRNPYGSTFGVRVGAGLQRRYGTRQWFAEVAPHLALTDFGTNTDFGLAAYIPLLAGIRF